MYKVLIVDDELYVRKGLIGLIDWQRMPYELCGEAEDGQQALAMIEQLRPELVIVDIRMPVMDGLELIRQVKAAERHQPLFIIVSGYHDFSYAQQALRYDVTDYILKPVDERELAATLKKAATTLNRLNLSQLANEQQLAESVIETLLQATPSDPVMMQIAKALELDPHCPYSYVIVEVQDGLPHGTVDYLPLLRQALGRCLHKEALHPPIHVRAYNQYGLLLPASSSLLPGSHGEHLAYSAMQKALERETQEAVVLFAGRTVPSLSRVAESFNSANECLKYRFAAGMERVVLAADMLERPLYYFDVEEELHRRLLVEIEEQRRDDYLVTIHSLFSSFSHLHFAPSAVSNTITRSLVAIMNAIRLLQGNEEELSLLGDLLDWQDRYRNVHQLQEAYIRLVDEAAAYIAGKRNEHSKGSIDKVKKYIDAHYTENITLKSIAATFYMNSIYLGQLFRKTYGSYFNEYVLSLRIEEAKRLLRQTDMRIYEIAEQVGFQSADYFATQFEKLERMTPTDYRNRMIGRK
ncbi:response regulator [Paenibacillus sp. SYP-B4298]|uniref:response regulator n=1 Tax=Paenibacillus sp. SYP-B4298 TaxID=2996034 RepID=UPI0022DD9270|nr:response regulator [Paenibacillus sp. SYP-B4298]